MELNFLGTISTIIGTILGFIALMISLYHTFMDRKEKLEDRVKSAFLGTKVWTNEGVAIGGLDTSFFDLCTENSENYVFSGLVKYSNVEFRQKELVFYFSKIFRKSITLTLYETIGYREVKVAKAKLKFINPDLFEITFSKGNIFKKNKVITDLPSKTKIFPSTIGNTKKNDITMQDSVSGRTLTTEIVKMLSPERNYAKAKEILGIPDKTIKDCSVFDDDFSFDIYSKDDLENVTSDIYFLNNANLKVTTIDKQSIHALTVFFHDDLFLPDLPHYCEDRVCQELLDNAIVGSVRTIRESSIALRTYMGPPFYKHMTYFINGYLEDEENPNEKELIDNKFVGFCLSDSQMVFYIYEYELR